MKNLIKYILILISVLFISCNKEDETEEYTPVTPVVMDLTAVPYPKLSDYKFFDGELKNQTPAYGVLPFRPESELFTDYAEKKRFVWMPSGTKATYVNDYTIFNMPTGSALIKNFYYNRVQPSNTTKIIETRIMIKKADGWIYATYIWNDEQTEAFLNMNGSTKEITWIDNNSVQRTINYEIPNEDTCAACHTIGLIKQPLAIKPQNLNGNYNYGYGNINQLTKWISYGFLENNLPSTINSVVNYKDATKSLNLRVRSYFDANCAHCHQPGGAASSLHSTLNLQFNETTNESNMGVCATPEHTIPGLTGRIVVPGNIDNSQLYYRVSTNDPFFRMPFKGRTIVHQEGVQLIADWINSLTACP